MGLIETEAIVLRTYRLAEADKIAICLTQEAGLMRGVARGARRLKSRFGAGLEPFSLITLEYFEIEGRELVSIRRAEILKSFFNLATTPDVVAIMEYLVQLVIDFAPPQQPEEKLFRMVRACFAAAIAEPALISHITLYYELWMLKLSGFLPDFKTCGRCQHKLIPSAMPVYLNFEGILRCKGCKNESFQVMNGDLYKLIRWMPVKPPLEWSNMCEKLSEHARSDLIRINRSLITRALEKEPRGRTAHASGI
ncbi:MAG: DNA repair protein RecO [Acidobacteria bacterium]|nr:DNA repair protein RecO [Acidobacteriota bacterium]